MDGKDEIKTKLLDYVIENLDMFRDKESVNIFEIGDGNVNYVYRVNNDKNSVIVKFSDEYIRGSTTRKLSVKRSKIEYDILKLQHKLSNGMTPEVYLYSKENHIIVMEDLTGYKVLREAIKNREIYSNLSKEMAKYLYRTLFKTTDLAMDIKEKKELVASLVNYDMCEISERLVFTEPYMNTQGLNSFTKENEEFVQNKIYNNEGLKLNVSKLKNKFMTKAQSMIHGDLHAGSVFINKETIKVFDPEFAFYGPMGYDIGNVVASLFISYIASLYENNKVEKDFEKYLRGSLCETVRYFMKEYNENYYRDTKAKMFKNEDFKKYYLNSILFDSAGYAGTEIIRRTIGVAKVWDIDRVKANKDYHLTERKLLEVGMELINHSEKFVSEDAYKELFNRIKS